MDKDGKEGPKRESLARRSLTQARETGRQVAKDVAESTDSSLLAAARFFGLLYGPIDRRLRIDQALKKALAYRLDTHVGWRHALGGITYVLFLVLVVTGVLLSFYYRPSVQEAYPSIQHIVTEVSFGWLIRDVHYWSANLIVVVVFAHMARVLFETAYKPPRETNWSIGLLLLFVVLAFGATGYLLPWDQWAYWTVTTVLRGVSGFPLIGGLIAEFLTGDVAVSGATLSRYFALHVILLPWLALVLLSFHFVLIRRHGIAPPKDRVAGKGQGIKFFPQHVLRMLAVTAVVLAVVVSLAALFPRPVAEQADPGTIPDELVSTWALVDVSFALTHYLGRWGFPLFAAIGLLLMVLPLLDRDPERHIKKKPLIASIALIFFVGFAAAWIAGRTVRIEPSGSVFEEEATIERGLPLPELGPTPPRPPPGEPEPSAGEGEQ